MSAQEFEVGQSISGTDYDKLPVGAKFRRGPQYSEYEVTETGFKLGMADTTLTAADYRSARRITYLPAATEPEDKDDLYVEPESLRRVIHLDRDDSPACGAGEQMRKVGEPEHTTATKRYFLEWHLGARSEPGSDVCADCALIATEPEDADDVEPEPLKPAFHDDDVHHLKVISGSTTIFDGLAVFEEADSGNITVTPVPRCTSLFEKAGSILRCGQHEGHSDGHWTVGSTPAAAWSDERAYGRVTEGGAS